MMKSFQGIYTAILTPFNKDLEINYGLLKVKSYVRLPLINMGEKNLKSLTEEIKNLFK